MLLNYLMCDSSGIDLVQLEKCLRLLSKYYENQSDSCKLPYAKEVQNADLYLTQLANLLFYEKHDSNLIKQLLLWYNSCLDDRLQCCFTGFIETAFESKPFLEFNVMEKRMLCCLNLYRLGFMEPFLVRVIIWRFCKHHQLQINGEFGFTQYLKQCIATYGNIFPIDKQDSMCFDLLINRKWTTIEVSGWSFDDIA